MKIGFVGAGADKWDELDLAWAAGIFEGEGWAGVVKGKKISRYVTKDGRKREYHCFDYRPQIRIDQNNVRIEMLEKLKNIFGGYILPLSNTHSPASAWTIRFRHANKCAEMILPYCVCDVKRNQLKSIINHYREKE